MSFWIFFSRIEGHYSILKKMKMTVERETPWSDLRKILWWDPVLSERKRPDVLPTVPSYPHYCPHFREICPGGVTLVSLGPTNCAHGLALTGVREVGVSLMHVFLKISRDLNSSWPIFHMQRRKSLTLKENSQTDVENGFILLWLNCSGGCCIYYYIRNYDKVMFSVCVCVCDVLCVCVCVWCPLCVCVMFCVRVRYSFSLWLRLALHSQVSCLSFVSAGSRHIHY